MNPINIPPSASFFQWRPAAWLRVSGADAAGFLQGQFTNDLRGLAPGEAVYGLWLNIKGKVLADSFVLIGNGEEEFWLGSYFSPAATIQERLESHIIADDVTVEDLTAGWRGIASFGISDVAVPSPAVFRFQGRRMRGAGREWVYPEAAKEAMEVLLGGNRELTEKQMERLRIEAGIPAVPVDIGPGDLPNEGGLEGSAISYTKGCYLGQEVMARLKSMGQVRRRLLRVSGMGAVPVLPAPIFSGERRIGELRSAARADGEKDFVGLAMLSLLHLAPAARLSFAPDAESVLRLADSL